MSSNDAIAREAQRRRWLRPDWRRWMREDADRFAPSGVEARGSRSDHADDAEFAAELNRLRAQQGELRRMLAGVQFELALRRLRRKYSPDQPREPAGNGRESGRWTDGGGGGTERDQSDVATSSPSEQQAESADVQKILAMARQLRLAGSQPSYKECLDRCYGLLERPLPRWSDRNTFDSINA